MKTNNDICETNKKELRFINVNGQDNDKMGSDIKKALKLVSSLLLEDHLWQFYAEMYT